MNKLILPIVVGMASAMLRDLVSYRQAVNSDPAKRFDWRMLAISAAIGGLTGFLGGNVAAQL